MGDSCWERKKEKERKKGDTQEGEREREREEGGGVKEVVDKDVMDEQNKSTSRRRSRRQGSIDSTVQIFVQVEGRTLPVEMSPTGKVGDIVSRVTSGARGEKQDMYVTCEGKVLRKSDELKSCRLCDGSTVQITSKMRGGGKHR